MPVSVVEPEDVDWLVSTLRARREPLVRVAPVYWRPAPDAAAVHRAYLEHLLRDGGARAYCTERAVLVAVPRREGWLVDDAHAPDDSWASDGRELWDAFAADCHGDEVRFVCPTHERERAQLAGGAGLAVAESWWLMELPGASGGDAGVDVELPGAGAVTVAAPPVYDPGGPVLFLPDVVEPDLALAAAVAEAPRLGCPAVVVSQLPGHDELAGALAAAGFRRHCDFHAGPVRAM